MNRLRILLLLILFPALSQARTSGLDYFNTDYFWEKLVVDDPGDSIHITRWDTAIVVASNRKPAPGQLRFMSEIRDRDSIRFFIVYSKMGKWHVQQQPRLREAVTSLVRKDDDWVVYTEGMGKIFTSDLDRGMRLAGQYEVNVLLLDYPSIRSTYKSYRNYRFAYGNACRAYTDFVPVLDSFKKLRTEGAAGNGALSLFFHSMGNNVLRKIAQQDLLYKYNDRVWVDNIILNAPCVPRRKSRQWMEQVRFAKRMYVHYNPEDGVLKWARIAGFRQILGEHAKMPIADSAVFVNFNTLCGRGHSNFLSLYRRMPASPEALAHYGTLFHGDAVNLQDTARYRRTGYRSIGWDILPGD
jgi:hypothetical protein